MGMFDKVKFWKKEDDFSDLSNLGDFGLEEKPGMPASGGGLGEMGAGMSGGLGGGMGEFPPVGMQGMNDAALHREELQPTQASKDIGEQFGLKPPMPTPAQQAQQPVQYPQQQAAYAQQQFPTSQQQPYQQYPQPNIGEMAKDIEIMNAKLDAIRSTLDSINQRLATLERIAGGEPRQKYGW